MFFIGGLVIMSPILVITSPLFLDGNMSVFFDGKFLCVQLSKNKNYKVVLDIAKNSEYSEYLAKEGIYLLPPTRQNAKLLFNEGYAFDESAKIFIKDLKKEERKNGLFNSQKKKMIYSKIYLINYIHSKKKELKYFYQMIKIICLVMNKDWVKQFKVQYI